MRILVFSLSISSVGRVQRLTSEAVLTGRRLLARSRLMTLAHRGLELGLTGLLFMAVGFLIFFRAGSINVDPEDCANLWLISQHDELMHSLSFQDPACLAGCKYQTCYT